MKEKRSLGMQLVVIATIYLVAALILGFVMGVSGNHSLFSVHSHLGLLGWTTMALAGIVYIVIPSCERSRLARVHFWLHNVGLPVMITGLAAVTLGDARFEPAIGVGSLLVVLALLAFAVNVVRNGRVAAGTGRPMGLGA
jgi:hypothetical protein